MPRIACFVRCAFSRGRPAGLERDARYQADNRRLSTAKVLSIVRTTTSGGTARGRHSGARARCESCRGE